ncbi:MAG: formylglycine-generating enzyme family protein, partial [Verrucomicrobiota bacterium]
MNERENRFPLTCAASSSSGCARQQVLISSLASSWSAVALCLLLIAAGTNFALAQNTSQMFLRLAGPATSFIEGGSFYSGLLLWTNAMPGLAYRLQTRTDLGPDGKWNNYRVYHATGVQMVVNTATPDDNLVTAPVPAGAFQMGDALGDGFANERPVHTETISAFLMSKFEVSQAQFASVMGYNPSSFSTGSFAPSRPVEEVTWFDAVEFCNLLSIRDGYTPVYTITDRNPASGYPIHWATVAQDPIKDGYRLPMEAEWEYAARGGDG